MPENIAGMILLFDKDWRMAMEDWAAEGDVVIFTRMHGNEEIVCAFNLGPRSATVDLGAETALSPVEGHGFTGVGEGGKLKLGAYGAWFGRFA